MSFDLIPEQLQKYCNENTSAENPVLSELDRYTHANILQPRMLSGHFQGVFLSMISDMIKPKYVLEIGTYTGYSAICLASGLQEDGKLFTIDKNPENEDTVNSFFSKANLTKKIVPIIGDAYQIIRTLHYPFDLVFIDADKRNYKNYLDLVIDKVDSGGYILTDNVQIGRAHV
jgi:predicted O-methyltransferase YrrM